MNTPNVLSRSHQRARCALFVLSLSCLLAAPSAFAQVNKDVINSGNWTTAGTWDPSGAPSSADSIVNTGVNSRVVDLDGPSGTTYAITDITNNSGGTLHFRALGNSGDKTLNVTGNIVQDSSGTLAFSSTTGGTNRVNVTGTIDVLQGTFSVGLGDALSAGFNVTGLTTVKSGALLDIRVTSQPNFNGGVVLENGSSMRHVNPRSSFARDTFGGLSGSGTFTVENTTGDSRTNHMRFFQNSGIWDYAGNIVMDQQSTGALTTELTRNGTDGAQILRGSIGNHSGATTVTGGVLAFAGDATLTSGNIQLNNTNSGVGSILGVSSNMTRSLGSGAGAIRLSGERAGFAAYDNDATVSLGASVTWDASNFTMTNLVLGHSSADRKVTLSSAIDLGDTTRSVVVHNGSAAVDGVLSGVLSGDGGLTKTGDGALELSANNTYTGTTTVSAGALIVNGAVAGATTVSGTGVLSGSGTMGGAVTIGSGGTLAIGNSAGTMTFEDDLTLELNSTSIFEINGFDPGQFDLALGTGQTVTFNGTLSLVFAEGFATTGSIKIFDFANSFGSFSSPVNTSGLADGYTATFSELDGMVTVVPEPSTYALLGLAAAGLAGHVIRRRRRS